MRKTLITLLFIASVLQGKAQIRNDFGLPPEQNYYVEITAIKGNQTTTPFEFRESNTIVYTTAVKWVSIEPNRLVVEVCRTSDVVVNSKASDLTVANNLAVRTSAALYPLVLSIKTDGTIDDVVNYDAVVQRWKTVKEELKDDFYGDGLDKHLHEVDKRFSAKSALVYVLNSDCFLSLFFNNAIYADYSKKQTAAADLYFPYLFDVRPLKNRVTLEKGTNSEGDLYVSVSGKYTDERTKADLESKLNYSNYRNSPKAEATFGGTYFVNPLYNTISSILFYYSMELEVEKSIFVKVVALKKGEELSYKEPRANVYSNKIYIPMEYIKI